MPIIPSSSVVSKVAYYVDYFLSGNRQLAFPGTLHMAVLGDLSPENVAARGNLKSITPEEQRHALILAIGRDIANGQSDDALLRWRHCVLSTIVTFTKYDSDDDLFWAATNQRESIGAHYEVVYYSTVGCQHKSVHFGLLMHTYPVYTYIHALLFHQVQRIFQLMAYKAKQEASGTYLTHVQLADLYSSKVMMSSGETVSRDYVGASVHVYNHILSDVNCRTLILQACHTHQYLVASSDLQSSQL